MSYPSQFGYSYQPSGSSLTSSQLLMPGAPLTTSISTPCCESTRPAMSDPTAAAAAAAAAAGGSGVYSSGLLSYPRVAGLADSVYGSAYAAQGYVPFGADPSAFYSPLNSENGEAWRSLSQSTAWPYDPNMAGYPYGSSYGGLDVRRKNATRESTSTLKAWLYEHIKNPYPTKGEKIMLAIITKMTLTQVSTWFANARRRLKKENKMQWSPRNRTGDEDDDKVDSDDDGRTDAKDGGAGIDQPREEYMKTKNEDEDIVVDGGNDNDSLLSMSDHSQDELGRLGNDDAKSDYIDINSSAIAHLTNSTARAGVADPLSASALSLSNSLAGQQRTPCGGGGGPLGSTGAVLSPTTGAVLSPATGALLSPTSHDKPRIWSLADVATSDQDGSPGAGPGGTGGESDSPGLRRPPSPSSLAQISPHQAPYVGGGGGGGGISSRGFQPWLNDTYATSPATGRTYNSAGYTSVTPHALPSHAQVLRGISRPDGGGSVLTGLRDSIVSPTNYVTKLQNGFLGDKHDLPQLASGFPTQNNNETAFKPVQKRL